MTWTTRPVSDVAPDGTAFDLTGPDKAPVMALVHGLGLCRHLWTDHLPAFSERFRVLNYDLYGHGDSAPSPGAASLETYAGQLVRLMDHLGIPQAAIVGFSIGGMINRRFAMDYPDRVSALAILNSPHDRGNEAQALVETRARKVREQGANATLDDALKRWFTPAYLASGDGVHMVRRWRGMVDPESYAETAWVLANGVRELIRPPEAIRVPALVMTCENDSGSTVKMSHDIASEIDGSETVIVPGLQHLGLMEQPQAFTSPVLEFLERTLQ
ncbi:alpha/beta fold hydrolase [Anderseniella sp. Alg231-50]|uniref:alpha/beta fold hydrolase n=1 Tax=Anderseniella sp. Alg231-50 TaxID=1922226 RepID=UPI000D55564D